MSGDDPYPEPHLEGEPEAVGNVIIVDDPGLSEVWPDGEYPPHSTFGYNTEDDPNPLPDPWEPAPEQ